MRTSLALNGLNMERKVKLELGQLLWKKKKKLYGLFLWIGFNCLKARATSSRQSTLEPPSGFEHGTPGLAFQRLNH